MIDQTLEDPGVRVAVLCGGLGTRLGALARGLPKPMIPIGGRPYLERVLQSFAERGFRNVVLLTGYRSEVIEGYFGDGARFGLRIEYGREAEPLGTGGALRDARSLLGDRFLVTYGDVLRRFDYDRFVRVHHGNCVAVYPRISVGNIALDPGSSRVTLYDKRSPGLPFIDAGFSVMEARTIDLLPATGACSFEEIVFPALARGAALEAEVVGHEFFDIGTPDELARTRAALEVE